jgi:GNAT superfamily N-acetyltransferase
MSDGYPANWPNDPIQWLAGAQTVAAWVAEDNGSLIGHVALAAPDPDRAWPQWVEALAVPVEGLAVVRRLFVASQWREGGLATALVERAENEAFDRQLAPVLDVAHDNHAAIMFWKDRRWREVGQATLPPGDEGRALRLLLFVAG